MLQKGAANLVASFGAEALLAFGGVEGPSGAGGPSNESLMRVARTPPKLLPGPLGHPAQAFTPEHWDSVVKPASIEAWKNVFPFEDLQPGKVSTLWKDNDDDTRLALVLASVPRARLWQKAVAVPAGGDPGDPDALWSPQVAACMLTLPEAQALHEAVQKHDKFSDAWAKCTQSGKACAHTLWAIASAFSDDGNLIQSGFDRFKHEAPKATNDIINAVMKLSNAKFSFSGSGSNLERASPKDIIGAPLSCTGRIPWFCFVTIFRQNDTCPTSPLCVGSADGRLTQDETPFLSTAQTPSVLEPLLIACKMQCAQQTKQLKKTRPALMIKLKVSPLQTQTSRAPLTLRVQGEFIGPPPPERRPQAVAISDQTLKLQKNQVNPGKALCAVREKNSFWAHVEGSGEGVFKIEGGFLRAHKGDKFGLVQCERINPFALSRNKGKAVPISASSIPSTGTTLAMWLKKQGGDEPGFHTLKFVDPIASAALFGLSAPQNVRPLGSIEGTHAKFSALAQSLVLGASTQKPITLGWVPSSETLVLASESGKVHTPLPLHGVRVVPCVPVDGLPVVKEASDVFQHAELQPLGCGDTGKFRVLKQNIVDVDPSQMCFVNPEDPRHQAALERSGTHTGKGELALCDSKTPLPPSCTEWIEMLEELESSSEVFWAAVKQLIIEPNATEFSCVVLPNKFT